MADKTIPANVRLPDWQTRLFALIEANMTTPFSWGEHDCVSWGAKCVFAVTGKECDNNKAKRKDEKSAARVLKKFGGLYGAISSELDSEIPTKMAQRGDIVLLQNGEHEAVGVCVGTHAACVDYEGLRMVPMDKAVSAWRL